MPKNDLDDYIFISFSAKSDRTGKYSFEFGKESLSFSIPTANQFCIYRFLVKEQNNNHKSHSIKNFRFEGILLSSPAIWIPQKPNLTIVDVQIINSNELREGTNENIYYRKKI